MRNNLDVCPVSQCAAPLSYSWRSTLMHSSLQPSSPNSVGWDKLCTSRASQCQGPAQTLPAERQQPWKAGSVPAAGNGKCLGPNLVPLTADMKWRVAEWEETLRGRVKIILEIMSRIIFVCEKSALIFCFRHCTDTPLVQYRAHPSTSYCFSSSLTSKGVMDLLKSERNL